MEKVLLVARLGKFFSDFELNNIAILQEMGYEVWCAGNFDNDNHKLDATGVKKIHLNFQRSPLSLENIREYKKLIKLMQENDFKLLHCHMPIGGVFARLAAHKCGLHPVIYTAHGFQFCKGGPIRDWLLFYPVEKFLSRWTDMLITINQEDYELASRKFHMKEIVYLNGIGINFNKFANGECMRNELCEDYRIPTDACLLLSVGELNKNKNHEAVIRGIALLKKQYLAKECRWNIHYFICGVGSLDEYLRGLCKKLGVADSVHFLGWRDDIANICKSVDVFVFPSKREGLPVALMEAMSAGIPVITSAARGNTELVEDGVNGILCRNNSSEEYAKAICDVAQIDRQTVRTQNSNILEPYRQEFIREKMISLYKAYLASQRDVS